jgi:transitional endoplasmic reticulum ATPase
MADPPAAAPAAAIRKAPYRLIVDDAHPDLSSPVSSSVVYVNPGKADELDFFRGQTVVLKGKCRSTTVAILLVDDGIDIQKVGMEQVIRRNLRVNPGSIISIHDCTDCPFCTRVSVLPYKDTVENFHGDLFELLLKPYFAETTRPIRKGDNFTVGEVEFKVLAVEPGEYGLVIDKTEIFFDGEPIERDDDAHRLEGYDDVGQWISVSISKKGSSNCSVSKKRFNTAFFCHMFSFADLGRPTTGPSATSAQLSGTSL